MAKLGKPAMCCDFLKHNSSCPLKSLNIIRNSQIVCMIHMVLLFWWFILDAELQCICLVTVRNVLHRLETRPLIWGQGQLSFKSFCVLGLHVQSILGPAMLLHSLILSLPTFLSFLNGSFHWFLSSSWRMSFLCSFSSFLVGKNLILIREFQQWFVFPTYAAFPGKTISLDDDLFWSMSNSLIIARSLIILVHAGLWESMHGLSSIAVDQDYCWFSYLS